jgi:eukaryotic-like serine/threonine-protein kinase
MTTQLTDDPNREAQLVEVLLAYVEARQVGREPDRAELLAAHPDLRDDLEEFFAGHDEMERRAAPLREDAERVAPSQSLAFQLPGDVGQLGDFRLVREIGRGGMGVVYEAEQISLRRRVALKVLPFAAALDLRQLQRFKNEALAAAHLRHENIVPVHAVGEERGVHFYAMQFIEGRSLAALIGELKATAADSAVAEVARLPDGTLASSATDSAVAEVARLPDGTLATSATDSAVAEVARLPDGTLATSATAATSRVAMLSTERSSGSRRYYNWVANLGRQGARALEHAHTVGIVHRDVKPANLLLDPQGQLWVADFGLARMAGDPGLTVTGEMLGTLRYASPEQALARRGVVDHRSDVYSLGATLYELLTLRPLFESRDRNDLLRQIAEEEPCSPRSLHPGVPRELETVVLKALGKEPSERYSTARELADDLQRFLDNRPVLARRPTSMERLWKLARRHPSLVGAGLVVLLLLLAGSLLSTFLIRNEQERTLAEQRKVEEAYRRERERAALAEARFRLARGGVDEMFRISQEELADRPGLERARRRLLWSVLAYYQEFLDQRRDDPEAQADLREAKQRVEQILADLTVLRAASQLYLLAQPEILDELRLSETQRPKVKEFCTRVGNEWLESLSDAGRVSPAERGRRAVERARLYEAEVRILFTPAQQTRLRQIGLQAEGPGAFAEPEVVAELQLSLEQREQIRTIEEEAIFSWMRGPRPGKPPGGQDKPAIERLRAILTEEQVDRWNALTGEAAKFPIAPFGSPSK